MFAHERRETEVEVGRLGGGVGVGVAVVIGEGRLVGNVGCAEAGSFRGLGLVLRWGRRGICYIQL